jgi:hypothetical protein
MGARSARERAGCASSTSSPATAPAGTSRADQPSGECPSRAVRRASSAKPSTESTAVQAQRASRSRSPSASPAASHSSRCGSGRRASPVSSSKRCRASSAPTSATPASDRHTPLDSSSPRARQRSRAVLARAQPVRASASPRARPTSSAALVDAPSSRGAMACPVLDASTHPASSVSGWGSRVMARSTRTSVPISPSIHGSVAMPSMTASGTLRSMPVLASARDSSGSSTSSAAATTAAKGPAASTARPNGTGPCISGASVKHHRNTVTGTADATESPGARRGRNGTSISGKSRLPR